jgi:hypothetical protein
MDDDTDEDESNTDSEARDGDEAETAPQETSTAKRIWWFLSRIQRPL